MTVSFPGGGTEGFFPIGLVPESLSMILSLGELTVTKLQSSVVSRFHLKHILACIESQENFVSRHTFTDQMSTVLKNLVIQFDILEEKKNIIKLCTSFIL